MKYHKIHILYVYLLFQTCFFSFTFHINEATLHSEINTFSEPSNIEDKIFLKQVEKSMLTMQCLNSIPEVIWFV